MTTVGDIVRRTLPNGTRPDYASDPPPRNRSDPWPDLDKLTEDDYRKLKADYERRTEADGLWARVPWYPTDCFAVVAQLLEHSGGYHYIRMSYPGDRGGRIMSRLFKLDEPSTPRTLDELDELRVDLEKVRHHFFCLADAIKNDLAEKNDLADAIKNDDTVINALKRTIADVEAMINALKRAIADVQAMINALKRAIADVEAIIKALKRGAVADLAPPPSVSLKPGTSSKLREAWEKEDDQAWILRVFDQDHWIRAGRAWSLMLPFIPEEKKTRVLNGARTWLMSAACFGNDPLWFDRPWLSGKILSLGPGSTQGIEQQ